jgi:hypothetical protein
MTNNLLQIKIKERLNKLSSMDYDNIECWQIVEAFNKAQLEWVRNQVHGNNQRKEGDGSTKMLIDDLQPILAKKPLTAISKEDGQYFLSETLPQDYLYYKRLSLKAANSCCPPRNMTVYLAEAADVDELLGDALTRPSSEWGETFSVMAGNRFEIYTDGKFTPSAIKLSYYRSPRTLAIAGCGNADGTVSTSNVTCEFKDDVAELIIDETCAILAGDIELFNQYTRAKQNAQSNN